MLAQIPTYFGRLAYLGALCDRGSGRYRDPSLSASLGGDAADRSLRHQHHQAFMAWLRLDLAGQKADLDEYLRTAGTAPEELAYRELIPQHVHDVERQLYLTDLEVVLQLISFDREALSAPTAWPRR